MIVSERVRSARKKQQLSRLKAKKGSALDTYPDYYAAMPSQKTRAKQQGVIKAARDAVNKTLEDLQVAQITGENLAKAEEDFEIAKRVLEKHESALATKTFVSLTGGG